MASGIGAPILGEERVLFVGNSFTIGARASVPTIFDRLAQAGGHLDPLVVMRAVGGQDYEFHAGDATTRAVIASEQWTHVILQNYSTEPTHLVSAGHSLDDHFTHGIELYRQIVENNPATQVLLFETWSRADAHPLITGTSDANGFASTAEMQAELRANYQALADAMNAMDPKNPVVRVAPVGDAWENAGGLRADSDSGFADLHGGDDYHGNDNGYYLAAAVFYCTVYGRSPEGLASDPAIVSLGLNLTEDAGFLERIAWDTYLASSAAPVTYRFDFGAIGSSTSGWNNVDAAMTQSGPILSSRGEVSGMALTITAPFGGANQDGTSDSAHYPATATGDSLFGHSEPFGGRESAFPAFLLSGLGSERIYSLKFFASRMGVGDDRTTRYTVEGAQTKVTELEAAGNVNEVATVSGVRPDDDGRIHVSVGPGETNSNPYHFTYLGVLEVEEREFVPLAFVDQPADVTVEEFRAAEFSASVRGIPPFDVRWLRDGEAVPGAETFALAIEDVPLEADGATIQIRVTDASGSELVSPVATLRVTEDLTRPTLVGVSPASDGWSIEVRFSERMAIDGSAAVSGFSVASGAAAIPVVGVTSIASGEAVLLDLGAPVSGAFTVSVSPMIADRAGNPLSGELEIAGVALDPEATAVLIDFGSSGTPTPGGDGVDSVWNNVTQSVGGSDSGGLADLKSAAGVPTGIRLEMVDRFNGANTNGTTQSGEFPASATRDSLFGNTEAFSGLSGIFPRFRLAGLAPGRIYDLTFFASRMGVSDNRETSYTVTGLETVTVFLDPANNVDGVATLAGIRPDGSGAVEIALAPGPSNTNANHFTYLGALRIEPRRVEPAVPILLMPEIVDGAIIVRWSGDGLLDVADSPTGPWTAVNPPPTAPYIEPVAVGGARFYRLRPAR